MTKLLIGTDPEFFLRDSDGNFVSAHDKLPGTKDAPYKVKHGAVQVDGLACEFNIDPASSGEEFEHNTHAVLGQLRKMIPKKYGFNFNPTVDIPKKLFESLPDNCKELGCDPDLNIYLKGFNKIPKNVPMRTGSGHIHFGWTNGEDVADESHRRDCEYLVQALDFTVERVRFAWDNDTKRQTMYGSRGSYRPKPYGCEYRVLSNAWLKYPNMWPWLFNFCQDVFNYVLEDRGHGGYPMLFPSDYGISSVGSVANETARRKLWQIMVGVADYNKGEFIYTLPPKNMFEKKLEM